jgi:hypothetical protein
MTKLLNCPFCGRKVDNDLMDTLYPTGTWWRDNSDGIRSYHSYSECRADDNPCMEMNCTECNGGCGASIAADTVDEVIAKWNRRS